MVLIVVVFIVVVFIVVVLVVVDILVGFFSPSVSFPKPLSPLLDISIIIGDEARLSALVAGFKKEISSKGFSPWKSLEWFQNEL